MPTDRQPDGAQDDSYKGGSDKRGVFPVFYFYFFRCDEYKYLFAAEGLIRLPLLALEPRALASVVALTVHYETGKIDRIGGRFKHSPWENGVLFS